MGFACQSWALSVSCNLEEVRLELLQLAPGIQENNDDPKSASKGFAFVNFENAEAAHKAVEGLPGKEELAAKGKTLYVARAQKKAERSAKLKAKFDEVSR